MTPLKRGQAAKRRGRPKNIDEAILFSTTLPKSVLELLDKLSKLQRRTKSEILSDAVRAYARRFTDLI
jgi:metal-responsive CopG/Arc/MetJ family transcriptional regulator